MAALIEAYPGLTPREYWLLRVDERAALVRRVNARPRD